MLQLSKTSCSTIYIVKIINTDLHRKHKMIRLRKNPKCHGIYNVKIVKAKTI